MSVECKCQCDVDFAELGETVLTVAERMRQRSVGCLVVVNDAFQPVGIVTDRDLVLRVLADGVDPYATKIEEIMTVQPKTVTEGADVESALRTMRGGAFRRVPVVNQQGRLVGIMTLDDILMNFAEGFTHVSQVLNAETPRAAATPCKAL